MIYRILIIGMLSTLFTASAYSLCQAQNRVKPEAAFVRSLILPGWGHYYVNSDQWRRGQIHLGTEVALIASYFGFRLRAGNLKDQYETLASLKAGVDISDRSRTFRLAVGDFNSIEEYNNFQLRSRNWNRLYEVESVNQWKWESEVDRDNYNNLKSDVDRVKNQLPAILGLMVVNRVLSAISSYNRAKKQTYQPELNIMPISVSSDELGIVARVNLQF
ncbi:hypothetical protein [Rhodohalobacter sulfatireducens]|uniref:DUF5683 domain-containing protein n=1 Tax=Rhodohalobacter sulfatireducens TaxID=2911366 RepID=A0ABS9KB53_9BACT|nr:hypothetical protein [Rhodohalobacter sulfatireducens]MCG2588073.1 hypothetical protein [Rhodohalobacter sulfatireducens]